MAIVEQMRKPIPDAGVVRHAGEEALLYVSREIGPEPKRRPTEDLFIIRHRHSPFVECTDQEPTKIDAVPVSGAVQHAIGVPRRKRWLAPNKIEPAGLTPAGSVAVSENV
jgi:hypothetical protein